MVWQSRLELAAASNDIAGAEQVLSQVQGTAYRDLRGRDNLPFLALVTATTDRPELLEAIADVGFYLVCRRTIKPGTPRAVALFPMLAHPERGHDASDAHWRDQHAPLALEHHPHMTAYDQLSVLHRFSGPEIDGFALCGFGSVEDLRERFYVSDEGVRIIGADVAKFADVKRSPNRLIATPLRSAG
jgi:hypothetical protein